MIKIYGKQRSRAARCMWVLEELGLDFEQVAIDTQTGETKTSEFLTLNPSGKVPVLDDDGFILRESVAISFYLVAKNTTPLWPDDIRTQALIYQWACWAATELEAPLSMVFAERRKAAPGNAGEHPHIADHLAAASKALDTLENHLSAYRQVAGADFTLGDLLACSTVMLAPMFINMAAYPAIGEWMKRCMARAAWQSVAARP